MKLLSAEQSNTWLKKHRLLPHHVQTQTPGLRVLWPERPGDARVRAGFVARLASLSDWTRGVLVLSFGMPRTKALSQIKAIRAQHAPVAGATDLLAFPGHLLDADAAQNQSHVGALLGCMLSGYVEGMLATRTARFYARVGSGIIDFHGTDKSLSGRLREAIRDLGLRTL